MFKTLVRRLGRPPRSYADYERMFAPDARFGGWARGDGAQTIRGDGWTLWNFNDAFISGLFGAAPNFIRNSQLLTTDDGEVWWLSSGGGEEYAGAETFPDVDETTWTWPIGGFDTGDDSAIVIAGGWVTAAPYTNTGWHCTKLSGLRSDQPRCSAVHPVGLDIAAGVSWSGVPFKEGGYVYIFGIHYGELSHYVARHPYELSPTAYASGWEYWAGGSSWSGSIAARENLTIGSPGLRALSVIRYQGKYIFSAKAFDAAPEISTEPDSWPWVYAWEADDLTGPLTSLGTVAWVARAGWYAYSARLEELPGIPGLSVVYSQNGTVPGIQQNYVYGPHFKAGRYSTDMSRDIVYVGPATSRTISTTDFNTVGVADEDQRSWTRDNGYIQTVSDAAATYLLAQSDFVDRDGLGFPESVDEMFADGQRYCHQIGAMGTAQTLDASQYERYAGTLSANCTCTLTGAVVGELASRIVLYVKQDDDTAKTLSFTPTVKWQGGSAYTVSTGLSALDKVELETVDGGTTWRGSYVKGFA